MMCLLCSSDHPEHCACLPLQSSFETYTVPIPTWLNKAQQGKFASKHIAMQKGDKHARNEIDEMFEMLIDGYKLQHELSEYQDKES